MLLKFVYRVGFSFALLYWRFVRPITMGVNAIVVDDQRRVLLVRNTYRKGWFLPGGGVNRGESIVDAVRRELLEEVGIECLESPKLIAGPLYSVTDGKHDHKFVFVCDHWRSISEHAGNAEIAQSHFFSQVEIPEDVSTGVKLRIQEFFNDEGNFSAITENFRWLESDSKVI